ncbi:hypothetical protein [Spirillospora sp. NPDC048824]|uniref:hypothetical protein n=1 Tax=unclassified Spirillospora TaxID=2642701 RepID=UPI0037212153
MPGAQHRLCTAIITVGDTETGLIHRSVLGRVADIAGRLGCRSAASVDNLPASFTGAVLVRMRRDLDEVMAFAEAARRTGWVLGDLAAAPGDEPVPVLDTPDGRVWASSARGFELHGPDGVRYVTELAGLPGTARRTALMLLITPLAEAARRAQLLQIHEFRG